MKLAMVFCIQTILFIILTITTSAVRATHESKEAYDCDAFVGFTGVGAQVLLSRDLEADHVQLYYCPEAQWAPPHRCRYYYVTRNLFESKDLFE